MDDPDVRAIERQRELWWEHMVRLRALTPQQKLQASAAARRRSLGLLRAGVRWRHPDWIEAQVEDQVGLLIHGPEAWEKFRERDRRRDHLPSG